jgi:hypothetical protein
MTSKRRMAEVLCGIVLLALATGCDRASTKTLNESSAKRMLTAKINAEKNAYLLNFSAARQAIQIPSHDDYTQGSYRGNDPRAAAQRLLRDGFMTQARQDSSFPNVSGNYKVDLTLQKSTNNTVPTSLIQTFSLSQQPTDATVSGQYNVDVFGGNSGPKIDNFHGPLTGSVGRDGTVHLTYGTQFGGTVADYKFGSSGHDLTLTGKQVFFNGIPTMTLTGSGPGGSISVPSFSYAFSSKFKPLPSPHEDQIDAGEIEVGEVSDLLLVTETIAQANFTWHVAFNDAAKALAGQTMASGTGGMTFGKQPDGNWVLHDYHF